MTAGNHPVGTASFSSDVDSLGAYCRRERWAGQRSRPSPMFGVGRQTVHQVIDSRVEGLLMAMPILDS